MGHYPDQRWAQAEYIFLVEVQDEVHRFNEITHIVRSNKLRYNT